jgi:two-component system phosphate regulon response regulator PhoB
VLSSTPLILLADSKIQKPGQLDDSATEACLSYLFAAAEVLSVVKQVLRRSGGLTTLASESADIVIDPFAMKISVRGKEITTTALEFRLLDYLARHQGRVFTRDALLDAVWGDLRFVTPRSVDACIRRIRRKIELVSSSAGFLQTIHGVGYKLQATTAWETAGGSCQCAMCAADRKRAKEQEVANHIATDTDMERVSSAGSSAVSLPCNQ